MKLVENVCHLNWISSRTLKSEDLYKKVKIQLATQSHQFGFSVEPSEIDQMLQLNARLYYFGSIVKDAGIELPTFYTNIEAISQEPDVIAVQNCFAQSFSLFTFRGQPITSDLYHDVEIVADGTIVLREFNEKGGFHRYKVSKIVNEAGQASIQLDLLESWGDLEAGPNLSAINQVDRLVYNADGTIGFAKTDA